MLDFSPVRKGEMTINELAADSSIDDLGRQNNEMIDKMTTWLKLPTSSGKPGLTEDSRRIDNAQAIFLCRCGRSSDRWPGKTLWHAGR